jgi:hypothetical protein
MGHFKSYLINATCCSDGAVSPCSDGQQRRNASTQQGGYNILAMICIFYVLLGVAVQGLCYADITKLSSEDRKALQDSPRFHEVHSGRDLPPAVVALCVDDNGKLADPGQNWNATDAVTDPTLPWKRLIWAAVGGDYYVVHYERGGIAHSFHVLVAKLTKADGKPKIIWQAVGRQLKDYSAFLDALRNGKLDDRLDYGH